MNVVILMRSAKPKPFSFRKHEKIRLLRRMDRMIRKIVIQKLGSECEICGEPLEDIHHCFPKGQYPQLRYDLDNLSVLCRSCHDLPNKIILKKLEKTRGKEWRKRLEKKARQVPAVLSFLWYQRELKKIQKWASILCTEWEALKLRDSVLLGSIPSLPHGKNRSHNPNTSEKHS